MFLTVTEYQKNHEEEKKTILEDVEKQKHAVSRWFCVTLKDVILTSSSYCDFKFFF